MVSTIYTIATELPDKDPESDSVGMKGVDAEVSNWIVTVIDSVDQQLEIWSNRISVFRTKAVPRLKKLISHQVSMISCHDACFLNWLSR